MTAGGVEFIDLDLRDEPADAARLGRTLRLSAYAITVLWALAAALCLAASLTNVFTYRFDGDIITSRGGYDADGHSLDHELLGDHGPRYAIVLWIYAAAAVGMAVVGYRAVRDGAGGTGSWPRRHAAQLGLVLAGVLAGLLASVALGLSSSDASFQAVAAPLRSSGGGSLTFVIGPALWLGIAALACSAAAVALQLRRPAVPAEQRPDEPPEPDAAQAAPTGTGDETLGGS